MNLNNHINTHNSVQTPHAVVMIRPHHFQSNLETMKDNVFQQNAESVSQQEIALCAYTEVSLAIEQLKNVGVVVHVFEDVECGVTPDSVFPNNWFSTHGDGKIIVYPMYSQNRRLEIRQDILTFIPDHYYVNELIDLSQYVKMAQFLEGTGSIVFDHHSKIAYACSSFRTSFFLLTEVTIFLGYKIHFFYSKTQDNVAIYHTNVMMSIGKQFAMVGLDTLNDKKQRRDLEISLLESGREIIQLSYAQIHSFAGNTLELRGTNGSVLAISDTAFRSLEASQIAQIEKYAQILPLNIPTIELAGGSVRCMLAGIHCLPK